MKYVACYENQTDKKNELFNNGNRTHHLPYICKALAANLLGGNSGGNFRCGLKVIQRSQTHCTDNIINQCHQWRAEIVFGFLVQELWQVVIKFSNHNYFPLGDYSEMV